MSTTNNKPTNQCIIGHTLFKEGDKIEIICDCDRSSDSVIPVGKCDIDEINPHNRTITLVSKTLTDCSYTKVEATLELNELQTAVDRGDYRVNKIDVVEKKTECVKAKAEAVSPKHETETVHVPSFSRFHESQENAEKNENVQKFEDLITAIFGILPTPKRIIPRVPRYHYQEPAKGKKTQAPKVPAVLDAVKKPKAEAVEKMPVGKTAYAYDTKHELPEFTFDHPYILPKYFPTKTVQHKLIARWMRTRLSDHGGVETEWYPFVFGGQTFLVRHRKYDNAITVKGHVLGRIITVRSVPIKGDKFDFEKGLTICMLKLLCQMSGVAFKMYYDALPFFPYRSETKEWATATFNKSVEVDVHSDTSRLDPAWNVFTKSTSD